MELVIGGMSAVFAGSFSNPLEVIKIRMQLQGELQARGKYAVHYRNAFHAAYIIGRKEGIFALQKGLTPALFYQFVMNGTRLGSYQLAEKQGLTKRKDGTVNPWGSIIAGAACGAFGAIVGSPFYLIKTHLQSKTNVNAIAVGHQHEYTGGMAQAIKSIYSKFGFTGLWRGSSSAAPRVAIGSAVQMVTFEKALEFVRASEYIPHNGPWKTAFFASLISGVFVTISMAPFDLVATRFYNQAVDINGKGLLYSSVLDCMRKVHHEEGILGFYKGWTANYFRLGPHTLLLLVAWDRLKHHHRLYEEKNKGLNL
ncbi:solute carrier family 25 member 35 [Folsomia candida]|uniref:Solute carrier family 25 member 35 n=1 Tax=Folsomia candida TaxID=158441 RepID=A0A226F5I6_FOLCA|nr:solute carrier family 25 member 35 [Folsomia candida]OXA64674.1 hypothetical protein Fcan01_01747 [Folsomia candida]